MLALPNFYSRIPDQTVIVSSTNEPADGSPASDKLISGMRGDGWAMVHLPYGGTVTVDLAKALPRVGGWNAWWINPRDGSRLSPFTSDDHREQQSFTSPTEGDLRNDWLLYIDQPSAMPEWPRGASRDLGIQ